MTRLLTATLASVLALLAASCCCTGETKSPRLRTLPKFQEIESASAPAPEVEVQATK